ncbi:MAG: 3-phosphoserine/phosphohydroxythreonine transaminase [Deltaproteobacteria bacterium]|nr:3-phosphoserine/phosphohydroxythreonine transaminase [Deltaproteobacteria bacterium]MBW1993652.1 3-phosphoserine/phosphohydroxythreonine transaminase [Deltaproteobacteria bacterium]MBW2150681.1 3-phosphoserine/phosphohydroxythreonine transaminase [Deltaproteobacteria bacterium]
MKKKQVHNFNPGPSALPLCVLEEIQESFLDYQYSGMSIVEISHRSRWFEGVLNDAVDRLKRLLKLDERFHVLFLQGGASLQFCMVPMNFLKAGDTADYVNTGLWSAKAIKEAQLQGKSIHIVASSEDRDFSYIPQKIPYNEGSTYLHFTSNNTIRGTQFREFPESAHIPLVADMSSDIMSRPFDVSPFGFLYGGIQKNLGAAGACLAIIRKDFLERVPETLPTMLSYRTHASKNSLFNTPACFSIYTAQLVLKWLEETIGGLEQMASINQKKAQMLYGVLDESGFYNPTAEPDSRSLMNITFRLSIQNLEAKFIQEAEMSGFYGLKGHRSVGGCRVSIYNAVTISSVAALVDFMKTFERKYG